MAALGLRRRWFLLAALLIPVMAEVAVPADFSGSQPDPEHG